MSTGERLRAFRTAAGMSLADVARGVGLSAATLSRWETGRGNPDPARVAQVAAVLGIDPAALGGEVPPGASGDVDDTVAPGPQVDWREYAPRAFDPVLEAALACFLRLGYHGTTMRHVAEQAGMSVPNLYHYYPSKQAVLVALMDHTMGEFGQRCENARRAGADAAARFTLLVECFALFHTHRRDLAFIGASEMRSIEEPDRRRIAQVRSDCQHMIDEELRVLADGGRLRVHDAAEAGRAVVTMLVGIAAWYQDGGPRGPADIAADYVGFAIGLVGLQAVSVT